MRKQLVRRCNRLRGGVIVLERAQEEQRGGRQVAVTGCDGDAAHGTRGDAVDALIPIRVIALPEPAQVGCLQGQGARVVDVGYSAAHLVLAYATATNAVPCGRLNSGSHDRHSSRNVMVTVM